MAKTMNPMSSERVLIWVVVHHETETMGNAFEAMTNVDISIDVFDSSISSSIALREMTNISELVMDMKRPFSMRLIVVIVSGVNVFIGINNLGMTDDFIVFPKVGILVDNTRRKRRRRRSLDESFSVKFIILEVALFDNF